jgi:hypothetical protein
MTFLVALVIASIVLVGCATTPVAPSAATQVPGDRLLAFQERTADATAVLVITRDAGFPGSACYFAVTLNGTLAARLDTGETARFYMTPGEIRMRVGRDPMGRGLCGLGLDAQWTQRETVVRQEETKHFRLLIDANGKTDIQRSD